MLAKQGSHGLFLVGAVLALIIGLFIPGVVAGETTGSKASEVKKAQMITFVTDRLPEVSSGTVGATRIKQGEAVKGSYVLTLMEDGRYRLMLENSPLTGFP